MNKHIRNSEFVILLILLLVSGCEKDDKDSIKTKTYGKVEIIKGDNQSGYFGELLTDSIIIKASSTNNNRIYLIKYELIQGNGVIMHGINTAGSQIMVDSTGILKLRWRLGCNNTIQKVRFLLYVDSTKGYNGYVRFFKDPSASVTVNANGTKLGGWGRSCGCENLDYYQTKIISFDKSTHYLVSRGLYSSSDGGMNWNKVEGIPKWEDIVDAQFNSLGWLYVLTRNNGICFSKDMKQWDYINNGILDHRDPTAFLVEDSALFVSFYFDGPYKTTDNGKFWRKLIVGGNSQRFYFITRHPNGNIYLFDDWHTLWISIDYGKSWQKVNLSYKYVPYSEYDFKIDKNGIIYIGAGDATISIINSSTYQGESHTYYQWNGSSQEIENIQITDDNVYYLVRGNPRPGIYSKLNNWDLLSIGFSKTIYYYYLKSDNTFMLLSPDGMYYYNKN